MDAPPNELLERIAKRKRQNVQRVLRHRQRRREGGCCFTVDLSGNDVAALVQIGMLAENQRGNPEAVEAAFSKLATTGYQALKAKAEAPPSPAATDVSPRL
jgi:hypothetical protein